MIKKGWTFSQPLVERCAVEPDLDGCAVPRAWAGEDLRRRGRRREGDGARGAQEAPGRQPRQRGVHERVPLRHSVEQLEGAEKTRQIWRRPGGWAHPSATAWWVSRRCSLPPPSQRQDVDSPLTFDHPSSSSPPSPLALARSPRRRRVEEKQQEGRGI